MLTNKSKLTDQVGVPHEPGEWMKFRPLSWLDMQAARDARLTRALQRASGLLPEALEVLRDETVQEEGASVEQLDQAVILRSGIAEWSYGEPVSPETIGRLDERTAEWAYEEIVRRNVIERAEGEG